MVKNLPAVRSLGWDYTLEEGMATHSSILAWRIPMDRGACSPSGLYSPWGHKESKTTERISTAHGDNILKVEDCWKCFKKLRAKSSWCSCIAVISQHSLFNDTNADRIIWKYSGEWINSKTSGELFREQWNSFLKTRLYSNKPSVVL